MAVIFAGMFIAFLLILNYLPLDIGFHNALEIAGANGKMEVLDFSFDIHNKYTFWSGIIGGSFLALSYFGTDQSQVQRYLSGSSLRQSQMGLIFNGLLKVPMQFGILLVGIMVFVFYQFNSSPLHFNPAAVQDVMTSEYAEEYKALMQEKEALDEQLIARQYAFSATDDPSEKELLKEEIQILNITENELRDQSKVIIKKANPDAETNDKDYVFIHFILENLPRGLIGLLLAVILSAAMSSTASELNALGSTTAIDLYKRSVEGREEKHYVRASKWFTLLWGIIAIMVASVADLFDNLINLVNIVGSLFYGNVLGIFLLAFFIKYVGSRATFLGAIITQLLIFALFYWSVQYFGGVDEVPYLWLNLIGCVLVMGIAVVLQLTIGKSKDQLPKSTT